MHCRALDKKWPCMSYRLLNYHYSQTCLKRLDQNMWFLKAGDLLTKVDYREKCTFGDLKGRSLNTGGLKDRLGCIYQNLAGHRQ